MLRSKNNVSIEAAVTAVARAHLRYPGVEIRRVVELAQKMDGVMATYLTAEATAALCVQLLRAIGARDYTDISRFRAD